MATEHFGYKEVGFKYTTGKRLIMPMEIDQFCAISGMREKVFLSDEVGRTYGAKGRVVPGVFLPGIALGLLMEIGIIGVKGSFFLGMDKFKVDSSVYPLDTVTVTGEVLKRKVTSEGDRVVVTYSWLMKNEAGEVVAQAENTCIFPNPKAG